MPWIHHKNDREWRDTYSTNSPVTRRGSLSSHGRRSGFANRQLVARLGSLPKTPDQFETEIIRSALV